MVEDAERFLALLESIRLGVLGTFAHGEAHLDEDPVGLVALDEWRPQPVVDRGARNQADRVHPHDVTVVGAVTGFSPLELIGKVVAM